MSDRSDEITTTREPRSTDELLEETEDILSGESGDGRTERESTETSTATSASQDQRGSSGFRLRALWPFGDSTSTESKRSLSSYFSPKAFLALVLTLGIGMVVGGMAIPFLGQLLGMAVTAFLIGLVTSKRRYLEVATAGGMIGIVTALADYALLVVAGSGEALLVVGGLIGVLAGVIAYYFGRDLRDGLLRDVED